MLIFDIECRQYNRSSSFRLVDDIPDQASNFQIKSDDEFIQKDNS